MITHNIRIRSLWEEKEEQWYFSVIDVVVIPTDSVNHRDHWLKMKKRVRMEGGTELSKICRQFKIEATDSQMRQTV